MKKIKSFLLISIILLLAACGGNSNDNDSEAESENNDSPDSITWGSSSLGSQGYIIIEALASTANKHIDDVKNSSVSTAGAAENIILIDQGEIQMGQATSDVLYAAKNGETPFEESTDFSQVFAYGYWSLPILVPSDSDIQTIEDLKGKKLNVGTEGGSSSIIANAVLGESGYNIIDDITLEHLNYQEAADGLKAGQIDASVLFHMGGDLVATPFQDLAQSMELRPLDFDDETLQKAVDSNEGLAITETSKDTFDFYEKDVEAPGMTGMLVTSSEIDEDLVYNLVKNLYENVEEVQSIGPELSIFELDYAVEGLVKEYPVHPGAAKFFKEEGLWEENMIISGE